MSPHYFNEETQKGMLDIVPVLVQLEDEFAGNLGSVLQKAKKSLEGESHSHSYVIKPIITINHTPDTHTIIN